MGSEFVGHHDGGAPVRARDAPVRARGAPVRAREAVDDGVGQGPVDEFVKDFVAGLHLIC